MVVVSVIMLAYTLDKNIQGEKLLSDINKLISDYKKDTNSNSVPILIIDIRTVTRDDNSLVPKLDYKPS